jgi:chromosome segregation ATPase
MDHYKYISRRRAIPAPGNDNAPALRSSMRAAGMALTIAALSLLAACAGQTEQSMEAIARADASIEQAEQSGARELASANLDAAKDKYSKAEVAVEKGDTVLAQRLAEEAELDAELAAATARTDKAEKAVEELHRSIETLRQEIARQQSATGETR